MLAIIRHIFTVACNEGVKTEKYKRVQEKSSIITSKRATKKIELLQFPMLVL